MIRLRHQYVLMWHLRDLQTVKWLILSVSLFKPSCPAATHTFIHPSTVQQDCTLCNPESLTATFYKHTQTHSWSLSLSLWWCWLSDKRLFASPPLPFSFPLHSSHISQVTLSSVPHTHTHTLNHGWTCLISTPLLCITSHSLHSHCIDPACRHT